jgi:hypothetical protein
MGQTQFAARSCCDLDLQGSDPNVARDTSSQYGDHFCEIVVKSHFKSRSYGLDTILLQGHAVTWTFKVATQNVAHHTSSQYGDHFCEIVIKSNFK